MKNRLQKKGFTLVELMVALMGAAVLVLTAGVMLWHTQLSITRLNTVVDVHRDMRASLDALTRMTRDGTNFTFTTGLVFTVNYNGRPPARVSAVASNLIFTPNTSTPAINERLANGTLRQFNVAIATNQATITLVLDSPLERMSNRVVVVRRN